MLQYLRLHPSVNLIIVRWRESDFRNWLSCVCRPLCVRLMPDSSDLKSQIDCQSISAWLLILIDDTCNATNKVKYLQNNRSIPDRNLGNWGEDSLKNCNAATPRNLFIGVGFSQLLPLYLTNKSLDKRWPEKAIKKEVSKGTRSQGERYDFNFNLNLIRKWCVRGNGLVRYGFNCYLAALLHCCNILQWINIELLRSGFNCRDDPTQRADANPHYWILEHAPVGILNWAQPRPNYGIGRWCK